MSLLLLFQKNIAKVLHVLRMNQTKITDYDRFFY
jgi:hypothetical protein